MEWMPMELRRPEVGSRARLGSSGGESAGKPPPGPKSQPRWGRQNGRLRTGVRCAIIGVIAQLWPTEITSESTLGDPP